MIANVSRTSLHRTSSSEAVWPMTPNAFAALSSEVERLRGDVAAAKAPRTFDSEDATDQGIDATRETRSVPLPIDVMRTERRLETLTATLAAALVVDDPDIAVIGRRVTIVGEDGIRGAYALVLPGDGDPSRGWVSVASPLGVALCGRRKGETVLVDAPAGRWGLTLLAVE